MSHRDPAERARAGRDARKRVPHGDHARVGVLGRRDPVAVLAEQNASRLEELVPYRHSRMLVSPFSFFRGAAAVMAGDLASTPVSGLQVQLCGDAHLANFGLFASPDRTLVFDINDFDETYPGPWEWDVKRLMTSLVVAGRDNGFSQKATRRIVVAATRRYCDAMRGFASMGNLALWRTRVDLDEARRLLGADLDDEVVARIQQAAAKARTRDHLRALSKLTEVVDGRRRIRADPPLLVPARHLAPHLADEDVEAFVHEVLTEYARTLDPGQRLLVESYDYVDLARKAVGVGSVGTRCWVVLMRGRDDDDPLLLQVKEAQPSVLARHLAAPPGVPEHDGQRVVVGQRVMQAASDPFLGWHRSTGLDGHTRDFYVRQLHDWKGSARIGSMSPKLLRLYAELCAWTLARAHARSGDRIALAAYLGGGRGMAEALTEFAHHYAAVNEHDHERFVAATQSGRLPVSESAAS